MRNKELSWLSFNARLLQEARDPSVPLLERIKFLGIFSSNLDEFFRVRVATLKRLEKLGKKALKLIGDSPEKVLKKIHEIVLAQREEFEQIYQEILKELARERIFIINERELNQEQARFVQQYFRDQVRPALIPIMIDRLEKFPDLKDHAIYLAIRMYSSQNPAKIRYALIELPTDVIPRFILLPEENGNQYIMLLDDLIRFSLREIFAMFPFDHLEAYTIKLTRDAELDISDDFSDSLVRKISRSLAQRKRGKPVRFIYDQQIPEDLLSFLIKRLKLMKDESNFIPGGRYHNFKDFINFPAVGPETLRYCFPKALPHRHIQPNHSLLEIIRERDILLHYPYQTFDYLIDFLREAAMDPTVSSIKMTLYRVAKNSKVINALMSAARNGKSVTVSIELQARFDEEANIYWSNRLQEEGVRVIHSAPNIKIHAKLLLVTQKIKRKTIRYASIGTGNFHEATARLYTDHSLFTADARLTEEVKQVFDVLENNYQRTRFRHLLVSPFNMRESWLRLIHNEIKQARSGKEAYIIVKLNNLTDPEIIKKLYQASQAGVTVQLMVRGMFSLVPGVEGMSENIRAAGIIDKYLEHSRLFVFCHGGNPKYFLSSADWMPRNLDRRVEVACPIYDQEIQQEIRHYLDIQWRDNVKARVLNKDLDNQYRVTSGDERVRCQEMLYEYLQQAHQKAVEVEKV